MIAPAAVYERTQQTVARICEQADEVRAVPACPQWSTRDLLAHLVGVADDVTAGNFERYGTEGWTAAQVAQRAGRPIAALLEEWCRVTPRLLETFDRMPAAARGAIVVDLVAHEHDLRGALSLPGHRDSDSVRLATRLLVGGLRLVHERARLPAFTMVAIGEREFPVGRGESEGSVRASLFALFRSLSGRRTPAEVGSFQWTVDPAPYLEHWLQPPFSWPAVSLREG